MQVIIKSLVPSTGRHAFLNQLPEHPILLVEVCDNKAIILILFEKM